MTSTQVLSNVRQQLKFKEKSDENAKLQAHKVELKDKSIKIMQRTVFIAETIVSH
jgi:hypothetical protein